MAELTTRVSIQAPAARVWQTMIEVERWPEWTPSVRSIERLEPTPLGPGSRVRIEQPKLAPAVWTVTDWKPEVAFIWVSRRPGILVTALHAITASAAGACEVTLTVRFEGLLAPLIRLLTGRLTKHYMGLEAAGLKKVCEA